LALFSKLGLERRDASRAAVAAAAAAAAAAIRPIYHSNDYGMPHFNAVYMRTHKVKAMNKSRPRPRWVRSSSSRMAL